MVLAGGLATRLRTAVPDRPKALANIAGRPFLSFILDQLISNGFDSVVLSTGYLGEQIESEYGSAYRSLQVHYSREHVALGTAGGLRLALPFVTSESVLVMNGDSYCETDLEAFWRFHEERRRSPSLLLTEIPDTPRFGRVEIDDRCSVISFREKSKTVGGGWINAGVYLLPRSLLESIPPDRALSLEEDVFPAWIGRGLLGYPHGGRFIDIGTPESFAAAEDFFRTYPT
jgi:NDP-sugar pyrophosphorylase family protein